MKLKIAVLFMILLGGLALAQSPTPSPIPNAPQIDTPRILAKIGSCTLQADAQAEYIQTLQSKIVALDEALKKAKEPPKPEGE